MSTDIKLRKAKISKKNQSGGSFSSWFANLSKKPKANVAIPLSRNNLPGLVSNLASNAINNFGRKIVKKRASPSYPFFWIYILTSK